MKWGDSSGVGSGAYVRKVLSVGRLLFTMRAGDTSVDAPLSSRVMMP
jgi:hypothetical protein